MHTRQSVKGQVLHRFGTGLKIDPANRFYLAIMLETMSTAGRWQDILDNTVPLEDADPNDLDLQIVRAIALFNLHGDLETMERVFEKMNLTDSPITSSGALGFTGCNGTMTP